MSSTNLPDFSSLAAKPPQRPTENLPSRPSTSNYKAALESSVEREKQGKSSAQGLQIDSTAGASSETVVSPTSASWRPNMNRQQSFSAQEHKRAMQSPLMSPKLERGKEDYGFSSKDDNEQATDN